MLLVDDVLATGGTMKAAIELILMSKATVECAVVIAEIEFLKGRESLPGIEVRSLIQI